MTILFIVFRSSFEGASSGTHLPITRTNFHSEDTQGERRPMLRDHIWRALKAATFVAALALMGATVALATPSGAREGGPGATTTHDSTTEHTTTDGTTTGDDDGGGGGDDHGHGG